MIEGDSRMTNRYPWWARYSMWSRLHISWVFYSAVKKCWHRLFGYGDNEPYLSLRYSTEHPWGQWRIVIGRDSWDEKILWQRDQTKNEADEEELGEYSWPVDMRKEYERLKGRSEFGEPQEQVVNIVELAAIDEDGGFDQPCRFGNRVDQHAIYCHNETWLYAPRKCRRTWGSNGERHDEDCPGYAPNPLLDEE